MSKTSLLVQSERLPQALLARYNRGVEKDEGNISTSMLTSACEISHQGSEIMMSVKAVTTLTTTADCGGVSVSVTGT